MTFVGAAEICRLDDRLLERIRRGERLGAVAISAVTTVALGAGAYGVALGVWRAAEQAVYSAIKLPLLLLSVAAFTLLLSVMLASLLRSKLSIRQTAVAILLSLAVASAVLGAMAPVSIVVALVAPPPDPTALGLSIADPRVAPSLAVARAQVVLHVAVVACAGIVGVVRLRGLLARLGLSADVLRRVLVGLLSAQFVVGVQLSWLLRPFLGRPHLAPTFSCNDLFEGNFFEELALALRPAFGSAAPFVLVLGFTAIVLAAVVAVSLRAVTSRADIEVGQSGVALRGAHETRIVPWHEIAVVRGVGADVFLTLRPDETLADDVVRIGCEDANAAAELARHIDAERTKGREGPFRTPAGVP